MKTGSLETQVTARFVHNWHRGYLEAYCLLKRIERCQLTYTRCELERT